MPKAKSVILEYGPPDQAAQAFNVLLKPLGVELYELPEALGDAAYVFRARKVYGMDGQLNRRQRMSQKGKEMTKEATTKEEARSTSVITPCDRYDTQMQKEIERLASCHTEAHVYSVPQHESTFVISAKPLSSTQVTEAYFEDEKEQARQMLMEEADPDGVNRNPTDVWESFCVSADAINQIAKQEGITLPERWFAELCKKEMWEPVGEEMKAETCGRFLSCSVEEE